MTHRAPTKNTYKKKLKLRSDCVCLWLSPSPFPRLLNTSHPVRRREDFLGQVTFCAWKQHHLRGEYSPLLDFCGLFGHSPDIHCILDICGATTSKWAKIDIGVDFCSISFKGGELQKCFPLLLILSAPIMISIRNYTASLR